MGSIDQSLFTVEIYSMFLFWYKKKLISYQIMITIFNPD